MFGRFAGEEQCDAVKGVLATNNPSKRMVDRHGLPVRRRDVRLGSFASL